MTQPVLMSVPVEHSEIGLIAALEQVMRFYRDLDDSDDDGLARVRAADWVAAKYGSPRK